MDQNTCIMRMLIKIMHLIFSNKEQRILKNVVRFKINKMFSPSPFEPDDLVKTMNMRTPGISPVVF